MKHILKNCAMLMTALCIAACSKYDGQSFNQLTDENTTEITDDSIMHSNDMSLLFKCYDDTKISEKEVIEIASNAPTLFDFSLSKKFKVISDFKKVNYLTTLSKTAKPVDSIPIYYINYEKKGFVIVSGDRRLPQILAYSPEGTYEDDGQSGYTVFMNRLPAYIQYTIDSIQSEYEIKKDSLLEVLANKNCDSLEKNSISISKGLQPTYIPERDPNERYIDMQVLSRKSYISPKYEHILSTTWHQGSPFNNRTPICTSEIPYTHMAASICCRLSVSRTTQRQNL